MTNYEKIMSFSSNEMQILLDFCLDYHDEAELNELIDSIIDARAKERQQKDISGTIQALTASAP